VLIEHGADPIGAGTTHELDVLGWAVCLYYGHTLLSAVALGDVGAIRELVASGADLIQRMDRTNQRTPLHLRVVRKEPAALAALIELGADLSAGDAVGHRSPVQGLRVVRSARRPKMAAPDCAPLEWATAQRKQNAVRVLTECGAGARTRDDLQRAQRIVTFLPSACCPRPVSKDGYTPLWWLPDHEAKAMRTVELLLAAAPIRRRRTKTVTPLRIGRDAVVCAKWRLASHLPSNRKTSWRPCFD
jgi:ankyrin repeat protein